ncbi:MAG: radical SAM protein, partial [Candidatus Zixiibacteriota bacterium]
MKFLLKKLGCPKNDVDGDYIAGKLIEAGHKIVFSEEEAEAVIVNTCSFILPAKQESINEILYYEKLKEDGKIKKLFITGCLSQRYGDEIKDEINGVDGLFGLGQVGQIVNSFIDSRVSLPILSVTPSKNIEYIASDKRFVDRKYPYEYLKIAEGCDRYCSYCSIPSIRGRYRSRPINEIVEEANMLANCGKKELILVSQEGTGYGRDFKNSINIIKLLRQLEPIDKIEWIRLMYLHPESLTDELIEFMTLSEKVLGYFDMPL